MPFRIKVEAVALNVPPVLVIEEPAAIVNVVDAALNMPLTLFTIVAGLPFKLTKEVEPVITVPEFMIDPPAPIFTVELVTVSEPVAALLLI